MESKLLLFTMLDPKMVMVLVMVFTINLVWKLLRKREIAGVVLDVENQQNNLPTTIKILSGKRTASIHVCKLKDNIQPGDYINANKRGFQTKYSIVMIVSHHN